MSQDRTGPWTWLAVQSHCRISVYHQKHVVACFDRSLAYEKIEIENDGTEIWGWKPPQFISQSWTFKGTHAVSLSWFSCDFVLERSKLLRSFVDRVDGCCCVADTTVTHQWPCPPAGFRLICIEMYSCNLICVRGNFDHWNLMFNCADCSKDRAVYASVSVLWTRVMFMTVVFAKLNLKIHWDPTELLDGFSGLTGNIYFAFMHQYQIWWCRVLVLVVSFVMKN